MNEFATINDRSNLEKERGRSTSRGEVSVNKTESNRMRTRSKSKGRSELKQTNKRKTEQSVQDENSLVTQNEIRDVNNNATRLHFKPTNVGNSNKIADFDDEIQIQFLQNNADEQQVDDYVTDELAGADEFEGDGIQTVVETNSADEEDGHEDRNTFMSTAEESEIQIGDTAQDMEVTEQIQKLTSNPCLLKALDEIVNKRVNQQIQLKEQEIKNKLTPKLKGKNDSEGIRGVAVNSAPRMINQVKSPSDTTLYAPALQNLTQKTMSVNFNRKATDSERIHREPIQKISEEMVVDKISNFVESIRRSNEEAVGEPQPGTSDEARADLRRRNNNTNQVASTVTVPQNGARERADKMILDAERFKASINPPGMYGDSYNANAYEIRNMVDENLNGPTAGLAITNSMSSMSDDDFFHLTCHVDESLREKIEKGAYVDLERLLPKERGSSFGASNEDNGRLEWVRRDGHTFLAPVNDKGKINSFRKWEQAFRTYATIYCGANPNRSKEIWQYISVISTAASSFIWENVANYDFTFRHLMQFNPQRSWAVTYTQMWNLSMRDPLPKLYSKPSGGNSNFSQDNHTGGSRKPKYCWNFNRGVTCKYGKNCRFIERCSYCDSPSHGVNTCRKVGKKDFVKKEGKKNRD